MSVLAQCERIKLLCSSWAVHILIDDYVFHATVVELVEDLPRGKC